MMSLRALYVLRYSARLASESNKNRSPRPRLSLRVSSNAICNRMIVATKAVNAVHAASASLKLNRTARELEKSMMKPLMARNAEDARSVKLRHASVSPMILNSSRKLSLIVRHPSRMMSSLSRKKSRSPIFAKLATAPAMALAAAPMDTDAPRAPAPRSLQLAPRAIVLRVNSGSKPMSATATARNPRSLVSAPVPITAPNVANIVVIGPSASTTARRPSTTFIAQSAIITSAGKNTRPMSSLSAKTAFFNRAMWPPVVSMAIPQARVVAVPSAVALSATARSLSISSRLVARAPIPLPPTWPKSVLVSNTFSTGS